MSNKVTLTFAGDEKDLLRSFDRVQKGAKDTGQSFDRMNNDARQVTTVGFGGLKAGALVMGTALIAGAAAAVSFSKELFTTSRQITDLDTKARFVFEDQLPAIQKWAEANRKAFGASRREVVGMAANLADLLKPMGFTAKQATDISVKILNLAGALSKWSGGTRTAAEVADILSDAMLGERDALKGLGISISQAEVDARLLKKHQEDLTGVALQQAQAVATQELIFEKSADAQKAWAEGGKAAAEKVGGLTSNVQELKEKLATALGPTFDSLAGKASEWLDKAAPKIEDWVTNKLPKLIEGFERGVSPAIATARDEVKQLTDSLASDSDEWEKLGQQLKDLGEGAGPVAKWALHEINLELQDNIIWARKAVSGFLTVAEALANVVIWLLELIGVWDDLVARFATTKHAISKIDKSGVTASQFEHQSGMGRFHDGGTVPGPPGAEVMAILQAGEHVSPIGGSGQRIELVIRSSGSRVDDLILESLRRSVEAHGGDVQVVVGR